VALSPKLLNKRDRLVSEFLVADYTGDRWANIRRSKLRYDSQSPAGSWAFLGVFAGLWGGLSLLLDYSGRSWVEALAYFAAGVAAALMSAVVASFVSPLAGGCIRLFRPGTTKRRTGRGSSAGAP